MTTIGAEKKRKKPPDSNDGWGNVSASPTDRHCAKNEKMKIPKLQVLWDFFGTFQNHKSFVPRLVIPCEKSVSKC